MEYLPGDGMRHYIGFLVEAGGDSG
jgi:hypothetical protein